MYQASVMQQHQQYLPPPQPLPSSTPQEFYAHNSVLPSTEYASDSGSADEGTSNVFPNQSEYDPSVSTIIDTTQSGSRGGIMSNLQVTGYPMQESMLSSSVGQESTLSYGPASFAQDFETQAFTLRPDMSEFDASYGGLDGLPESLVYPPYIQTSAPAVQTMPPLSDSQTITPLSNSSSPNTMPSLTSAYSHPNWHDGRKDSMSVPADSPPESLDSTNSNQHHIQSAVGDDVNIGWPSAQLIEHARPSTHFYQQSNPSVPGLNSQDQLVSPGLTSEAYARRNSSTTALAESMNTVDIAGTEPMLRQPTPTGLAARRQKARPANLGIAALRSASYSNGMPLSPGALTAPEQSLRRIRSGGVANNGRISKPLNSSGGQRSPLNFSFAETAASPKFARNASTTYSVSTQNVSSPTVSATPSSLAPPTPLTPGEFPRFPSWQSHGVVKTYPSNNNDNGVSVSWSGEAVNNQLHVNVSPPDTPLDAEQMVQYRSHFQARNQTLYRDTPPQSAPATQQSFAPTSMMPQSHSTALAQGNNGHFRRPSLPDTNHAFDSQTQWPAVPMFNTSGNLEMNNPMHFNYNNQQYADPQQMAQTMQQYNQASSAMQESIIKPNFSVHEYNPPQVSGTASPPRSDSVPKMYHFSNAGPKDYEAPSAKA
jgi:hypothetical protein